MLPQDRSQPRASNLATVRVIALGGTGDRSRGERGALGDFLVAHPVWSTPSPSPRCEDLVGDGPHDGKPLGHCAQINLPSLSYWNPLANHPLASCQIAQLGDAELIDGMFRVNGT
jgi:hypothetical protein